MVFGHPRLDVAVKNLAGSGAHGGVVASLDRPGSWTRGLTSVRVTSVGVAHPEHRFRMEDAGMIAASVGVEPRKATILVQSSQIASRATVLPPASLPGLGSIEARNDLYRARAPQLSCEAVGRALGE